MGRHTHITAAVLLYYNVDDVFQQNTRDVLPYSCAKATAVWGIATENIFANLPDGDVCTTRGATIVTCCSRYLLKSPGACIHHVCS